MAVGTTETLAVPAGAEVISTEGMTVLPGLWDMHGHFSLSDGILNIAGGITSVRDIGTFRAFTDVALKATRVAPAVQQPLRKSSG